MADQAPGSDQCRAEKAQQSQHGRPGGADRLADLADDAAQGRNAVWVDRHRIVQRAHGIDQPLRIRVRAADLTAQPLGGAMHRPCADRVHMIDVGQVDRPDRTLYGIQPVGQVMQRCDRQRTGQPQHAAAVALFFGQ